MKTVDFHLQLLNPGVNFERFIDRLAVPFLPLRMGIEPRTLRRSCGPTMVAAHMTSPLGQSFSRSPFLGTARYPEERFLTFLSFLEPAF